MRKQQVVLKGRTWDYSTSIFCEVATVHCNICSATDKDSVICSVLHSNIDKRYVFHLSFIKRTEDNSAPVISTSIRAGAVRVCSGICPWRGFNEQVAYDHIMHVVAGINHGLAVPGSGIKKKHRAYSFTSQRNI